MSASADLPTAPRPTRVRYAVVAALCLAAALAYVQRNSYGGAETAIRAALRLTPAQTGDALSYFFPSYALLQVPAGWLAQRVGPRRTLVCCAAGWSVALGLCAWAADPAALVGSRLLMGAFQAGLLPAATLVLAAWLPPSRIGTASGLLNSFMLAGGAVQSHLTGLLIGPLGWRGLFLAYAVPGLAWTFLFALWFRNRPADHRGVNAAELAVIETGRQAPATPRPAAWSAVLLSGALYWICLQQFLRSGANRFMDSNFATYLQQSRGLGIDFANELASLPQWACVAGGLVGGLLSDWLLARTGSRRVARQGLAVASLAVCLLFYAAAYSIPNITAATLVFSVGCFVFFFSSTCAYAVTMDMGGRNLGVIFGLMNMAGNFGSYAFTALAPRLVAWAHPQGPPTFAAGVVGLAAAPPGPLPTATALAVGPSWDWTPTLLLFVGMQAAALLCWLPLDPNGVIGERTAADG